MRAPRLTYANVASTLALFMAMGGVAWAAALPKNSVGSRQLRSHAVTSAKLARSSVTNAKLANNSVTRAKIRPGAVTTSRLAPASVTTSRLANAAVEPQNLSAASLAAGAPKTYSVRQPTIQQVGPTEVQLGQMTVADHGSYLLLLSVRAFPRASNPGHNLNCSLSSPTATGSAVLSNAFVPSTTGVLMISAQAITTTTAAPATFTLACNQIMGPGEITVTFDIAAIRVTTPA